MTSTRITLLAAAAITVALTAGCQFMPGYNAWDTAQKQNHAQELNGEAFKAKLTGDLAQALALFNQALEADPNSLPAHMGIGGIHESKGDYAKAAEQYEAARAIAPNDFSANYKVGLMYQLLDRLREAVQAYLSALSIKPEDFNANLNVATAYLQLNQPALALPYAQKAVRIDPRSQNAMVNLGAIYSTLGKHGEAVDAYRSAASLGDLSTPIAVNLVASLIKIDKISRAENTLTTMLQLHPEDARLHERMGYVKFKLGSYDESAAAYQHALKLAPNDTASLNGLGAVHMTRFLLNRDDFPSRDKAVAAWRKSVQIDPAQPRILDLINRYGS